MNVAKNIYRNTFTTRFFFLFFQKSITNNKLERTCIYKYICDSSTHHQLLLFSANINKQIKHAINSCCCYFCYYYRFLTFFIQFYDQHKIDLLIKCQVSISWLGISKKYKNVIHICGIKVRLKVNADSLFIFGAVIWPWKAFCEDILNMYTPSLTHVFIIAERIHT